MANLILLPLQDTYVSNEKPEGNYRNQSVLLSGVDGNEYVYRAFFTFDMGQMPADITVDSAVFYLYAVYSGSKNISGVFSLCRAASDWQEGKVTWNSQPGLLEASAAKPVEIGNYGWQSWDVQSLIRQCLFEQESICSMVLRSEENRRNDLKRFHSAKSYYYRQYRPYMEIRYSFRNSVCLGSRNTVNSMEQYEVRDSLVCSKWQNTSGLSMYTFFVQNMGSHPLSVLIQISPDRSATVNEAASILIPPGVTEALVPQKFGFFSRLAFKACFPGTRSLLKIWFQGQV